MEEGKTRFCGHCGNPLAGGEAFCGKCGTKVGEVSTLAQAAQPQPALTEASAAVASKKKSKAKFFVIGGVALALIVGLIFLIPFLIGVMTPKTRTMMVYMIGSNLESRGGSASLDITEMQDAGFNTEDTKVVVYAGGARKWQLSEIDSGENAILEVAPDKITKVQSYKQKSMVEPATLTEFIDFVYENYDSNLYDLVLWDHAGGPVIGFGEDEMYRGSEPMGLDDLGEALGNSKLIKDGKKFEFVGFDACLMGGIEIAMSLKDYSNYMIASEESEPNDGWNYKFLSETDRDKTSEEVVKKVVEDYATFYEDEYVFETEISLSAIDLNKVERVAESAGELFEKINTEVTAETFSKYSRALTRKQVYGYDGRDSESFDLVDLKDLISGVADFHPDEVAKVEKDIAEAVVYSESNIEYTNGLSVYFPTKNKQGARLTVAAYKDVAFSDKYYDFLKKYTTLIGGKRMVEKDDYDDLGTSVSAADSSISVELPQELVDNYQSARVAIYRKMNDEKMSGDWYMPVYQSSEVTLDGNVLKATTNNLQFILKVKSADGTEERNFVTLIEKERNGDYAEYTTFGVLAVADEESVLGFELKSYELTLRVDKDNNVKIREIREYNSESPMPSKKVFSLDEILWIDFVAPSMGLNHETSGTDYGTEVSIKDGDTMEFELADIGSELENMCGTFWCVPSNEVYYRFKVYDTQGEVHWLDMVKVNI